MLQYTQNEPSRLPTLYEIIPGKPADVTETEMHDINEVVELSQIVGIIVKRSSKEPPHCIAVVKVAGFHYYPLMSSS